MLQKFFLSIAMAFACVCGVKAQTPDPNYHIYLCYGQSNMEGNASIEPIDRNDVPERFTMMAAVNFNNPQREIYHWYTAVPPLARSYTGLTPADWFGRTMVDNLPEDTRVGVVLVAVGGAKIEHLAKEFDPATLSSEADWFRNYMAEYGNKPYDRLIECAKEAQKVGVIKGILLHQGCSNNGDQNWPTKVKKLYNNILTDLGLEAEDVPLLAGQVVSSDMGGVCGGMNSIINTLPQTIPTAHVISSANCPQKGDGLHFTAHGYRVMGCRYATKMLNLMGISDPVVSYSEEEPFIPTPEPSEGDFVFDLKYFNPSIWESGTFDQETHVFTAGQYGFGGWQYETPIDLSGYQYLVAELDKPMDSWTKFRVFDTASYWEEPYSRDFNGASLLVCELNGMMKNLSTGIVPLNTKTVYRVGFWDLGHRPFGIKHVYATNNDPYDSVAEIDLDANRTYEVYNMQGVKVLSAASTEEFDRLTPGFYVINHLKYYKR